MIIQKFTQPAIDADIVHFYNYVSVRDVEDAQKITTGSFNNLPNIYQGTAIWGAWEDSFLYILKIKISDLGDLGTGTSLLLFDKGWIRDSSLFESVIDIDQSMVLLKRAADIGDENFFIKVEKSIDWEARSQNDVLQGVQLALAAGAHLAARRIASQGASQFPNNEKIQKYAQVLEPPKVVGQESSTRSDLRANRDWLHAHRYEYQGEWVALQNGELLGTARTLAELKNQIGGSEEVFFIKVY